MTLRHSLRALAALALLLSPAVGAQSFGSSLVINENDADQTSTDNAEFTELFNTSSNDISLDPYVLVYYNGSNDQSYNSVDLDGLTIPANGYFVFCGDAANVPNCDLEVGAGTENLIQNGADAVALHIGSAADFPGGTPVTNTGLVDALVYGTSDPDAAGLLAGLNQSTQIDENLNAAKDTESIQRAPDGAASYSVATPTPGAANDGGTGLLTLNALLRGGNETTPNESTAQGGATATLDGVTLTVSGTFAGLSAPFVGGHVHAGPAGADGPVVFGLTPVLTGDMTGGSFLASANTFTVRPTFADSIRAGLAYVNVHSSAFPGGEIRDQLTTQSHTLPFFLSGTAEVPPNDSPAMGGGRVALSGAAMTVSGMFSGLTGTYAASHVHGGPATANGPVVTGLMVSVASDNMSGSWEAANNTFALRTTFADSLRAGLGYVNVHSSAFPGGEVRGQIGTAAPTMEITIAEARAAGVGSTVTVTGTVSRAMGAFTYMQDDTAGLTIRQTNGAFFDAVADGSIMTGTEITLTGTLSEFNSLLQINGGDLADFMVGATGASPAGQTVTLAELASNGEAYEAELVKIDATTFLEGVGTEFAPGTNYAISDDSDASGAVNLRVPSANDSDADGSIVPEQANVTGIIGQFNSSDPAAGYQLLLIRATDLDVIVANEGTEAAGLSLAVANPLRGATTVRFATGTPGTVTLVLHDALGRRVATLADGETDGGARTAMLDASSLASGVYVLRLESEAGVATRTLTVVR